MSARSLPLSVLLLAAALARSEEPSGFASPTPAVKLGQPKEVTAPTGDLPLLVVPEPQLAPRKPCHGCGSDYHPSHVYLPDANPDGPTGNCDGECHDCRQFWANIAVFCGRGDDLLIADRKPMLGGSGEIGYWLEGSRDVALQLGAMTAHSSFHETSSIGLGFDSPATLTAVDADVRINFLQHEGFRLDGLVGYQYLLFHEGASVGAANRTLDLNSRNQINGARVGSAGEYRFGAYLWEAFAGVTVGRNRTTVDLAGLEVTNTRMCLVPQFSISSGYQLGESLWLKVGYSFLYLSDVERPVIGKTNFTLHGLTLSCEKRF